MITEDQIARVRRMSQDLRHSPIPDEREDADALAALLAAVDRMPTREQLESVRVDSYGFCPACEANKRPPHRSPDKVMNCRPDCWLARALTVTPCQDQ